MPASRTVQGYLTAALVVAIWTGFILVSRQGGVTPLTAWDLMAIRYGTAAAILLPIYALRMKFRLFTRRRVCLAAVGGLGYALLAFSGFKRTPATHAAILLPGLLPFAVALAAWLMLGERPGGRRWLGLAVIGAGVLCLGIEAFRGHAGMGPGDLLVTGASLAWAGYTVLARRWAADPRETTVAVALLTALAYLPVYAAFLPKHITTVALPEIAGQAVYQGVIATIVQMLLYIRAVALIGPTRLGTLMALVPALAGFAAVPVLGETLSGWVAAGLLLVTAGALLCNAPRLALSTRRGSREAARQPSSPQGVKS